MTVPGKARHSLHVHLVVNISLHQTIKNDIYDVFGDSFRCSGCGLTLGLCKRPEIAPNRPVACKVGLAC